jgi:hypothetical protein
MPQHLDRRDGAQPRRGVRGVDGLERLVPLRTDPGGERLAGRRGAGSPVVFPAPPVAPRPGGRARLPRPVRHDRRRGVRHVPQDLVDELQPIAPPDRRQDGRQQPRPELAQRREVEAGIVQLQAQRVLPVDPRVHRLDGLPVGQVLRELQQRDQGQLRRGEGRLAEHGEERREVLIGVEPPQLVVHPEVGLPLREGRPRDPRRVLRHDIHCLRLPRHRPLPPWHATPRPLARHVASISHHLHGEADFADNITTGCSSQTAKVELSRWLAWRLHIRTERTFSGRHPGRVCERRGRRVTIKDKEGTRW